MYKENILIFDKIWVMGKYIMGIFCIVMLVGCKQGYYAPVAQNVPLFKEKNEAKISFNYSKSKEASFLSVMSAFAFTDKHAIQGNIFYGRQTRFDSPETGPSSNMLEGSMAFGWFKALDTESRVEIFIGNNLGFRELSSHGNWENLSYTYNKLFVQPSVGMGSKFFDIAATTSIGYMNLFGMKFKDRSGTSLPFENYVDAAKIHNNKNSLFLEPGLTLRIGSEKLKFQIQGVYSFNLLHKDLPFDRYSISFGFLISTKG